MKTLRFLKEQKKRQRVPFEFFPSIFFYDGKLSWMTLGAYY